MSQGILSCLYVGRDLCLTTSVPAVSATVHTAPIVLWALTRWAASDHFFLPHPRFLGILVEYLSFGYDSHFTST